MGTSASFALARKITACLIAASLSLALVPASAFAEGTGEADTEAVVSGLPDQSNASADSSLGGSQEVSAEQDAEGLLVAPMLASGLAGKPSSFINSDVALDGEPVIGSFTVDGLTYAVIDDSHVELVGVSKAAGASPRRVVASSQGLEAPLALPDLGSAPAASEAEADAGTLTLPESVSYEGSIYTLTSIAPYAFYLSGVASVTLPASVNDVDDCAFRSSDVASVSVAEGNPTYTSFDGALYSADKTRLLLIPEGRVGAVLLPRETEVAEAGKFSHCSLVDAISVEDGAAFASENGLLYDSNLTTLLRVPAGAIEITIREGCTTIAAGALEACAKLTTINAPSTVTSISPDIFHAIPAVSLPAASLAEEAPQLTAMVALSSTDGGLSESNPAAILVKLPSSADTALWQRQGFACMPAEQASPEAVMEQSSRQIAEALDAAQAYGAAASTISFGMKANRYMTDEHLVKLWWTAGSTLPNVGSFPNHNGQKIGTGWQYVGTFASYDSIVTMLHGNPGGWVFSKQCINLDTFGFVDQVYNVPNRNDCSNMHFYLELDGDGIARTITGLEAGGVRYHSTNGGNGEPVSTTSSQPFGTVYITDIYGVYPVSYENVGAHSNPASYVSGREDIILQDPEPWIGHEFIGWTGDNGEVPQKGVVIPKNSEGQKTYKANWTTTISFDTSSEPGDADYPGVEKPDQEVGADSNPTVIEDPKRPGYVFQGWVIPDVDGTEAIDQDLVYEGEDGKWYVDASKLPDYAGEDGRVELTARWTSVISVDVPSGVTFYADVVTQGNESREGLASSAFGQNKVQSQSEVDLRIVGLESKQVKGNDSTSLGASDILKKADGSTVSGTDDKLFSLYPATGELKEDDLKDPDATSASKPEGAVDFSLDDILLEKSFAAAGFTIPAGDTLSLGYRLNLKETSTELDYDKLSTLSEGASASIANISYCFAASGLIPTGSKSDPLWVENTHPAWGVTGVYGLKDIKAAAEDLSSNPSDLEGSPYYSLYKMFLDNGEIFHVKVDGVDLDLQLLGICQDTKTAGGKAGFTFQMKDIYSLDNTKSIAAGQGSFLSKMHSAMDTRGGWENSLLRNELRTTFFASLAPELQQSIAPVTKFQQLPGGITKAYLQASYEETIWLPSLYEICGGYYATRNESESSKDVPGYEPFGYQAYAVGGAVGKQKTYNGSPYLWWTRSSYRSDTTDFNCVMASGQEYSQCIVTYPTIGVVPCFCL